MFGFRFPKGSQPPQNKDTPDPAVQLAAKERADRTLQALTQGRLPSDVTDRLDKIRSGSLPWTSDLSISEWAALRPYRLEPLGQVMGSSFYHVGWTGTQNFGFMPQSHELQAPTQALYQGRRLAISRLTQEAAELGANAVVGVRIEQKGWTFEERMVEYVSYGTAVRIQGLKTTGAPVLASVSGQDFVRLLAAGSMPVGVALGACYYYLLTDWWDVRQQFSYYNQEMQHFQQGVSTVRHLVLRRLQEDARTLGGSGVIGADFSLRVEDVERDTGNNQTVTDHILEVAMLGTVVDMTSARPANKVSLTLDLRA